MLLIFVEHSSAISWREQTFLSDDDVCVAAELEFIVLSEIIVF
jgi:hypothetical protein